jgi:nucleotide-binding universal stress UspA family protein
MPSLDSVLIAIDFTPASDGVVQRALQLARDGVRRMHLVHVIDARVLDGIAGLGLATRSRLEHDARAAADQALGQVAERLRRAGVGEVDAECRCGRPDAELLEAIAAAVPQLVLAGGGNRMWRQVVLGSTARRMLRGVRRPLWLVRGDGMAPIRRVLLASDLGPAAAEAARLAVSRWPQAEFELLHVAENIADVAAGLASHATPAAVVRQKLEDRCRERMETFAEAFLAGAAVSPRLEHGHPVGSVLKRLQESRPDLLVLGRSGRHGLEATVLGSVAEALVEMADCDLLLVPAA